MSDAADVTPAPAPAGPGDTTLVDLLGQTRAVIVGELRRGGRCVAELAAEVGISEVAVRRHLQVLEREGLVSSRILRREGPGRPSAEYALTRKARRLFPDRSAEFANELLTFLQDEHGRAGLLSFLRWRAQRQGDRYARATAGADGPAERAERLASALSDDGFLAEVVEVAGDDEHRVLELRQGHCAVRDVAEEHPELCAYEAALFRDVLGAKVSRRQTIANGASACLCHIEFDREPTTTEDPRRADAAAAPHVQDVQNVQHDQHDETDHHPRTPTGAHHGHQS